MSLSSSFRYILLANLQMPNPKKVLPGVSEYCLNEMKEILLKEFKAKNTKYQFGKKTKQIRIKDIKNFGRKNEYLCILLGLCDKGISDAMYEKFSSGKIRKFAKEEDEGNPFSSHILIHEKTLKSNNHLMLIEKVPGLSTSVIKRYFRHLFSNSQYIKSYRNRNYKNITYYPLFEIDGHQSKTIRDALSSGVLQDIEFVSFKTRNDGFDEKRYIQEIKENTKLIIKRGIETNTDDSWIDSIINRFRKEYHKDIFIRIKTDDKVIKTTQIDASIDLEKKSVLDQYFIHNEIVANFNEPLEQSHDSIRDDLVNKMIGIAESKT